MERRLTTFVILLYNFLSVVTSYRCLQCEDMPLPNLCEEVGECGAHELCAVEQYVTTAGSFAYRQKCMDKLKCGTTQSVLGKRTELVTCTECCEGDLCNAGGCGEKGFDATLGSLCFACPLQLGTGSCSKIKQCGRDQDCSIHPVRRLGAPDNLFETKCTERNICVAHDEIDSSLIVGRKRSTCSICCNTTLCNDFDSRPCVPSSTTVGLSTVTTSATMMTTSSKATTTPTTKITPTQQVTVQKTDMTNSFTTAPVTQQACEDVPGKICEERSCKIMTAYLESFCRKTCNLCRKSTESLSTVPVTTVITFSSTTSINTSISLTRTVSSSTVSTIKQPGFTHGLFCYDIAQGCNQFLNFCKIGAYKEWSEQNCKRTCNYC